MTFQHQTYLYQGDFTEEEIRVRKELEAVVVPAIHAWMAESNPLLYAVYNGRCCKQVAVLLAFYLNEKLPAYTWTPWESQFDEGEGWGEEKELDPHAWVHGVHRSDSSQNLLLDYGKREEEYALWMKSRYPGYPTSMESNKRKAWEFHREDTFYRTEVQLEGQETYTGFMPTQLFQEFLIILAEAKQRENIA